MENWFLGGIRIGIVCSGFESSKQGESHRDGVAEDAFANDWRFRSNILVVESAYLDAHVICSYMLN